jgi:hypothetical protein
MPLLLSVTGEISWIFIDHECPTCIISSLHFENDIFTSIDTEFSAMPDELLSFLGNTQLWALSLKNHFNIDEDLLHISLCNYD